MVAIRPQDLSPVTGGIVNPNAALISDEGYGVRKATPAQVVDAGAPVSSQAEAEAGVANTGRMTALRTAQAISALGVSQAVLASPAGGEMVGLILGGKLDDGIKVLTAAMGGIPDDGNPAADVTVALQALADLAESLGLPVMLGARTYRVNASGVKFYTSVTGVEGTLIQSSAATATTVPVVTMAGPGVISNLVIDGNVSADPSPWNSGNYNTFTGATGLIVGTAATPVSGVTVRHVAIQNVRWSAFKVELGSSNVAFEGCSAVRCRDIFGDGFIAIGADRVSYRNCTAADLTRIGFVADTYGDSPGTFCTQIRYENCRAEDAHDESILYGGGEYNAGFWAEKSDVASWENCVAVDTNSRGFILASGEDVTSTNTVSYTAVNCRVEGAATGFLMQALDGVAIDVTLIDCRVKTDGVTAYTIAAGTARDVVTLINCSSSLGGANVNRSSVKAGPGTTIIDGFSETWRTVSTTLRDSPTDYYASLGHIADAVGKVVVSDWKTYDNAGALVYSMFKFLDATAATLDLSITRCRLRGLGLTGVNLVTKDVEWERLGSIDFPTAEIEGGTDLETDSIYTLPLRLTTKLLLFKGVRFDLTASAKWVALFNASNTDAWAKAKFEGCTIVKNFATGGNGVVLTISGGDAGTLAGTAGANDLWAVDCNFINTGSTTATPIFHIDSLTDAGGKLYGAGNMKSPTITNAVNGAGKLSAAASFAPWGT